MGIGEKGTRSSSWKSLLLLVIGLLWMNALFASSNPTPTGEVETQDMSGQSPVNQPESQVLVAPAQKPSSGLADPFQGGGDRPITSVLDLSFEPTDDGRWRITFVKPGSKAADKYRENQLVSEIPSVDDVSTDALNGSLSKSSADAPKASTSHQEGVN